MTTTAAAIRNACLSTIESLIPRTLAGDRFERYREDRSQGTRFEDWLAANPGQARRVCIRDIGVRVPPTVSNADVVRERVTFEVIVAFPVTNRYGLDGGRSMEDVLDEDQRQIDHAIGLHGSANIPSSAVILTQLSRWDRNDALETYVLLVGTLTYEFWLQVP